MEIIAYIIAILIGLALGLMGGGGSILTVPVLVYVAGVQPTNATAYSLFIVGIVAFIGGIRNISSKNFDLRSALLFGPLSIVSVYLTRARIVPAIPDDIIISSGLELSKNTFTMIFFAIVMGLASASMIREKKKSKLNSSNNISLAISGVFTGLIAGFAGAGGGFLIIPALIFFGGLEMKKAVGTSLVIISVQSLSGFFFGDAQSGLVINWQLLIIFSLIAMIGLFIGMRLSRKINGKQLKKGFGYFIATMAIFIIGKEILVNQY